jgi:hypothetical protein
MSPPHHVCHPVRTHSYPVLVRGTRYTGIANAAPVLDRDVEYEDVVFRFACVMLCFAVRGQLVCLLFAIDYLTREGWIV